MRRLIRLSVLGLALAVAIGWWSQSGSAMAATSRDAVLQPLAALLHGGEIRRQASLELRMISSRDEVKRMDALGTDDPELITEALARVDQIDQDLAQARAQANAPVDSLVQSTSWDEVEVAAAHLRARLPQSSQPEQDGARAPEPGSTPR